MNAWWSSALMQSLTDEHEYVDVWPGRGNIANSGYQSFIELLRYWFPSSSLLQKKPLETEAVWSWIFHHYRRHYRALFFFFARSQTWFYSTKKSSEMIRGVLSRFSTRPLSGPTHRQNAVVNKTNVTYCLLLLTIDDKFPSYSLSFNQRAFEDIDLFLLMFDL